MTKDDIKALFLVSDKIYSESLLLTNLPSEPQESLQVLMTFRDYFNYLRNGLGSINQDWLDHPGSVRLDQ
jgi:hypothetical protein